MKKIKIINILVVGLLFALNACTQHNVDEPKYVVREKINPTYTIKEVREKFMTTPESKYFSADPIISDDEVIISGIITSTDKDGNVYKYIVVQEEGADGQAIRVSIDIGGISAIYPIGQRVSIKLNGLCIGMYGQNPQIGVYSERAADGRVQTAGMSSFLARYLHVFPYGEPEPEAIVADTMTIKEIMDADWREINYKLICIKDAWFTGKGVDYNQLVVIENEEDKIFAPGTDGKNFPQSREIQDGTGSIAISTSEYAKFAQKPLPASSYKGNITAIISWYNNSDQVPSPSKIYHQLILRTLDDLGTGFEGYLKDNK